jgi:tetratricopeptide (TPR) repeat protein
MKKLFSLVIAIVILSIQGFTQDKKTPDCQYLKDAYTYFCQKKYKKVIKTLEAFRKEYPKHAMVEEAHYTIGLAYFKKGDNENAIKTFQQIIDKNDYPFPDSSFDISGCVVMGSQCNERILIPDYSLNVQHEACLQIAEIGFKEKNYPLVLNYLVNADRYYRYWYGCGTGDMEENMRMAKLFSRYYVQINKMDSAIRVLLPESLEPAALGVNGYSELKDQLIKLLKENFPLQDLKTKFDLAIENLFYESHFNDDGVESREYFIRFMDVNIKVAPPYLFAKVFDQQIVVTYIHQTDFYLELLNLPKPE